MAWRGDGLHLWRPKALALTLIVLAAGVALGAGGYALEQSAANWRPQVSGEASAWRITAPAPRPFSALALTGSHLVWSANGAVVLFDLDSGKARLLGLTDRRGLSSPALDERIVTWREQRLRRDRQRVWSYTIDSGRRHLVTTANGNWQEPALVASRTVWRNGSSLLAATTGGATRTLAGDVAPGIAADDGIVVYSGAAQDTASASASRVIARDLANGATWSFDAGRGFAPGTLTTTERTVVWVRSSSTGEPELLAATLAGDGRVSRPRLVARGLSEAAPRSDGGRVIFARRAATGGVEVLVTALDGGRPQVIASPAGRVQGVALSGRRAAWIVSAQGGASWIETTTLR